MESAIEMNELSVREKEEVDYIRNLVLDAKAKLRAYVNGKNAVERRLAFIRLGLNEGLYTVLKIVALDEDGDDDISPDEVKQFNADGDELIESHLNSLLNGGIVTALIFSVIFPIAYEIDLDRDSSVLLQAEFIMLQITVMGSLAALFMSASMFTQISFFLPSTKARLWYIDNIRAVMPILEFLKNHTLLFLSVAMMLHLLDKVYFPLNMLALVPLSAVYVAKHYLWIYNLNNHVNPYLLEFGRDLLRQQSLRFEAKQEAKKAAGAAVAASPSADASMNPMNQK